MQDYYKREASNKLVKIWYGVRSRTSNQNNKDYPNYGGRGIVLVEEWQDYDTFCDWSLANGYEEGLQLDRIDDDGDYCPTNCQWLTAQEHGKKGWASGRVPNPPRLSPDEYRELNRIRFLDPKERAKSSMPRGKHPMTKISPSDMESIRIWKQGNPNWKKDWSKAHALYGNGTKERYFRFWILDKI